MSAKLIRWIDNLSDTQVVELGRRWFKAFAMHDDVDAEILRGIFRDFVRSMPKVQWHAQRKASP